MLLCDIMPVGLDAEQHKFTCVDSNHIEVRMVENLAIALAA